MLLSLTSNSNSIASFLRHSSTISRTLASSRLSISDILAWYSICNRIKPRRGKKGLCQAARSPRISSEKYDLVLQDLLTLGLVSRVSACCCPLRIRGGEVIPASILRHLSPYVIGDFLEGFSTRTVRCCTLNSVFTAPIAFGAIREIVLEIWLVEEGLEGLGSRWCFEDSGPQQRSGEYIIQREDSRGRN